MSEKDREIYSDKKMQEVVFDDHQMKKASSECRIEKSICTLSKCSLSFTICRRIQEGTNTSRDAEIARSLSQALTLTRSTTKQNGKRNMETSPTAKDNKQTKGLKDLTKMVTKSAANKVTKMARNKDVNKKSPKKKKKTERSHDESSPNKMIFMLMLFVVCHCLIDMGRRWRMRMVFGVSNAIHVWCN